MISIQSSSSKSYEVFVLCLCLSFQGKMDVDEDKLETGLLPIQLPLAFHDRIKEEEQDKDAPLVKCTRFLTLVTD